MRRWPVLVSWVMVASVLLAGCLGADEPDVDPEDGPEDARGPDAPGDEEGEEPGWNATLSEAPPWQVGQWWTYEVSEWFTGSTFEVTIVVADEEDGFYVTGAADGAGLDESVILHIPGIGKIDKDDLSWDIHDAWFAPVMFPLQVGDTWGTQWSAQDVDAEVVDVSGLQATVEVPDANVTLVYDAEVQAVVSLEVEAYGSMEVVDHGFDHEGAVVVPYEYDLVIFHGRFAGVLGVGMQDMEPGAPVETIPVGGGYDRVSFILFALGISPGVYRVAATAPDGSEYALELVATEPEMIATSMHTLDDPGGDWEAQFVTAGAGVVFLEAFAFQVLEYELPGGPALMEPQSEE